MHAETEGYSLFEVDGLLARAPSAAPRGQFFKPSVINGGGILFRPEPLADAATMPEGCCSVAKTLGARQ